MLTPDLVIEAYRQGLFPMSYSADSPYVHWVCPEMRGQLSIRRIHFSRSLIKTIRGELYAVRVNTDFEGVITGCAAPTDKRPDTWINDHIIDVYTRLHRKGYAHSVECWQGDQLVGGIYGLAIGGAFFGESMFSFARDASKIALAHLTARLWQGGFTLFDTQFVNDHLQQFGVYEIPHKEYMKRLNASLSQKSDFMMGGQDIDEQALFFDYLERRV
ncbi:MAG: leucyl/phenylalanyl-tRNA--protein transferase [Bdellovibrionales bacterium]